MSYSFFETVAGHRFIDGTVPKLINTIESLSKSVDKLNNSLSKGEVESLSQFCIDEAEYRLNDRKLNYSKDDVLRLAEDLYDASESWIDSEIIDQITDEYQERRGL